MKSRTLKLLLVGALGMGLASPAIAGCIEDLDATNVEMTSAATEATAENFQQAYAALDDAKALCESGDEFGAADKIDEARLILGLPA